MTIEEIIIRTLDEAGSEGLSVKKLSNHLYNELNGLFADISHEDVYSKVRNFVRYNSGKEDSMLEKISRGIYRIKRRNEEQTQENDFGASVSKQLSFYDILQEKEEEEDDKRACEMPQLFNI